MNKFFQRFSVVLVVTLGLVGCDTHQPGSTAYTATTTSMVIIPQLPHTVWDRMAADFSFKTHHDNPRVQRFIKQYSREQFYQLITVSKQASPYLFQVVKLLEDNGLPAELALLPMIESEYRTTATSNRGAVGLWQLAYLTGKLHGLKHDQWYDARKDPEAATKVAITHLKYLYTRFDNDWLLALAAYNAGDARVAAAIRANKKAGKPTDYWSLNLPQETLYFVPKFLSLVYLIKNYRNLDIDLAAIPNKPYYDRVKLSKQIHLEQAAKLAEMDYKEIKRLNAACRAQVTHPKGPHEIILPVQNIAKFKANMNAAIANAPKPKPKQEVQVAQNTNSAAAPTLHTVHKGDTLNLIANKYRTTVQSLKRKNKLTSDIIVLGQQLAI